MAQFRLVILTTRGRKSGLPRHTPIEYRMHGTKIYLISGWGERPNWVQNLLAYPRATLQAGSRTYGADAHLVTDTSEVLRALFLFRKPAPAVYDALLARVTDATEVDARTLPELSDQLTVIRLDITDGGIDIPTLRANLRWIWGVIGVIIAVLIVLNRIRKTRHIV